MSSNQARKAAAALLSLIGLAVPGTVTATGPTPARVPVWQEQAIEARDIGIVRPLAVGYQPRPRHLVLQGVERSGRRVLITATPFGTDRTARELPVAVIDIAYDPAARRVRTLQRVQVAQEPAGTTDGQEGAAGGPLSDGVTPSPTLAASKPVPALAIGTARAGRGGLTITQLDPERTRDIVVDTRGRLYALEGRDIVRVREGHGARAGELEHVLRIRGALGLAADALIIGPRDGRFWALDTQAGKLHRLTRGGYADRVIHLRATGVRSPRDAVFAPSADPTDRPGELSLYIADAGRRRGGRMVGAGIKELTLARPATIRTTVSAASVSGVTVVNVIRTSAWDPPSPDPMGLDWDGDIDRLVVTDSEVEEGHPVFQGVNGFKARLTGELTGTFETLPWNNEAVGIAYDGGPNGPRYFISNDSQQLIWQVDPGADHTVDDDDARCSFSVPGVVDPEGLGFGQGKLFVADGIAKEVYVVDAGADGDFCNGLTTTHWDTETLGISDAEGIDFAPGPDAVFVVSRRGDSMIETSPDGQLVAAYSLAGLGIVSPSGLAYGPRSDDPDLRSVYVSARGIDNNDDPDENDGRIFELNVGEASEPVPVQLKNRGFEQDGDGDGRPDDWTENANFTRLETPLAFAGAHVGQHQSSSGAGYSVRQDVPGITSGATYRFSGQVWADTGSDAYTFKVRVIWRDVANSNIASVTVKQHKNVPTAGWAGFSQDLVAPAGAVTARVVMNVKSLSGTIWVDDFSFAVP
jgi:hypothetical protein